MVNTSPESQTIYFLEGESPSIGVLIQPMKTNLGHYREVVSEGDADYRETRSWISRPKCNKCEARRRVKLVTVRKEREIL